MKNHERKENAAFVFAFFTCEACEKDWQLSNRHVWDLQSGELFRCNNCQNNLCMTEDDRYLFNERTRLLERAKWSPYLVILSTVLTVATLLMKFGEGTVFIAMSITFLICFLAFIFLRAPETENEENSNNFDIAEIPKIKLMWVKE